jgi:hypothetical protein
MLAAETSTREAVAVQDSTVVRAKEAKDWASLVEREALERV